jgi:hypothetical protein
VQLQRNLDRSGAFTTRLPNSFAVPLSLERGTSMVEIPHLVFAQRQQ